MESSVEHVRDVPPEPESKDRYEDELAHHPSIRQYITIAIALAVATAAEVALFYLDLPQTLLIFLLLFFAILKFALVVMYFMHLKFDSPLFRRLFVAGLLLAISVYVVVLLLFGVFIGGDAPIEGTPNGLPGR